MQNFIRLSYFMRLLSNVSTYFENTPRNKHLCDILLQYIHTYRLVLPLAYKTISNATRIDIDTIEPLCFTYTYMTIEQDLWRKNKRYDSVLWQKPLHPQKNPKSKVTTQKRQQKLRLHNDCGMT